MYLLRPDWKKKNTESDVCVGAVFFFVFFSPLLSYFVFFVAKLMSITENSEHFFPRRIPQYTPHSLGVGF